MSSFNDLNDEINRGLDGKNSSIPMGFNRLNKYIGIRKKIYTLVFGATGSGKSAFVHSAYVLNPFDWYMKVGAKQGVKLKIILFSMERNKEHTIAKWVSRKIFLDTGKSISMAKMLGWWDQKMSKDEHDLVLMHEDYVDALDDIVDIIEFPQNPEGIRKYLEEFANKNGKEEKISEYRKIYIPNDENLTIIPIVDHMGLTKLQKGCSNKKEAIDKLSEHLQYSRDFYGMSPVMVAQINRNLNNPAFQKLDSFEPMLDDVKESGAPGEAADVVLSLFDPKRYNTNDHTYHVDRFTHESGASYFRRVKLLKSTYSEADIGIGMAFQGYTGIFKELPKKKDMDGFEYEKVFSGQYFLEE